MAGSNSHYSHCNRLQFKIAMGVFAQTPVSIPVLDEMGFPLFLPFDSFIAITVQATETCKDQE